MSPVPAVVLLMIFYMTSLIGFTTPHQQDWFLYYTPYFILINALLLLIYQKHKNKPFALFWGSCLLLEAIVELTALHTGALYGTYSFGKSMGGQLAGMPVIIPVYWLIIISSTAVLAAKWLPKKVLGRVVLGTTLTLGLILLVQLVAAKLDFWFIESANLWRYILVQGIVISLLQYLFIRWQVSKDNIVVTYIYGGLIIFFIGVVFFLK